MGLKRKNVDFDLIDSVTDWLSTTTDETIYHLFEKLRSLVKKLDKKNRREVIISLKGYDYVCFYDMRGNKIEGYIVSRDKVQGLVEIKVVTKSGSKQIWKVTPELIKKTKKGSKND